MRTNFDSQRIAKYLASAGVASRRDVEKMIAEKRVSVDGATLDTPAFKVTGREAILVDGKPVRRPGVARLWRYHKPVGLVTSNKDPEGRSTIFDSLPKELPRVVTIGRLDLNTEGLLLLTNDGELARGLELPATGLERTYRARAYGRVQQQELDRLRDGIVHEGVEYRAIIAKLERSIGANCWIDVTLTEGKNREVRRALESLGIKVNRLIRVSYGPVRLDDLAVGQVAEITAADLLADFSELIARDRRPDPSRGVKAGVGKTEAREAKRPPAKSGVPQKRRQTVPDRTEWTSGAPRPASRTRPGRAPAASRPKGNGGNRSGPRKP